ncbi:hypothetical protein KFE25_001730 [Diacronema lutheri]|uniref:Uncharacterized protein n=1 Tax=Diacronema lutheri TaxID=2081491 RepID=A0A8J5XFL3_DIALT|nr:hypothetical protein KFE25_001730 [Diacronema lutheri]
MNPLRRALSAAPSAQLDPPRADAAPSRVTAIHASAKITNAYLALATMSDEKPVAMRAPDGGPVLRVCALDELLINGGAYVLEETGLTLVRESEHQAVLHDRVRLAVVRKVRNTPAASPIVLPVGACARSAADAGARAPPVRMAELKSDAAPEPFLTPMGSSLADTPAATPPFAPTPPRGEHQYALAAGLGEQAAFSISSVGEACSEALDTLYAPAASTDAPSARFCPAVSYGSVAFASALASPLSAAPSPRPAGVPMVAAAPPLAPVGGAGLGPLAAPPSTAPKGEVRAATRDGETAERAAPTSQTLPAHGRGADGGADGARTECSPSRSTRGLAVASRLSQWEQIAARGGEADGGRHSSPMARARGAEAAGDASARGGAPRARLAASPEAGAIGSPARTSAALQAVTSLFDAMASAEAAAAAGADVPPSRGVLTGGRQRGAPSTRIRELGSAVEDAWARVAAGKINVDVEADRIATDALDGTAYVANGHTELAKLPSDERCRLLGAFRTNTRITILELSNTGVDNAAARVLADALGARGNASLTHLNIERNSIGSEGILALADMLPHNHALRELKLAYQLVTISSHAETRLADQLEHNRTLLKLTLEVRQVRARELRDKWLMRNAQLRRQQLRALGAGAGAGDDGDGDGSVECRAQDGL